MSIRQLLMEKWTSILKCMKNKESQFGAVLRHWLRANPQESCTIEIKQTETDSIPFSSVKQHQLNYSMAITSDNGVLIRVQGGNGEPDYVYLRKLKAYIGIKYPAGFVLIDNIVFMKEKELSKRKSLTWDRAKKIADIIV